MFKPKSVTFDQVKLTHWADGGIMKHNERKQNDHHLMAQLIELDASQIRMTASTAWLNHEESGYGGTQVSRVTTWLDN